MNWLTAWLTGRLMRETTQIYHGGTESAGGVRYEGHRYMDHHLIVKWSLSQSLFGRYNYRHLIAKFRPVIAKSSLRLEVAMKSNRYSCKGHRYLRQK